MLSAGTACGLRAVSLPEQCQAQMNLLRGHQRRKSARHGGLFTSQVFLAPRPCQPGLGAADPGCRSWDQLTRDETGRCFRKWDVSGTLPALLRSQPLARLFMSCLYGEIPVSGCNCRLSLQGAPDAVGPGWGVMYGQTGHL